MAETLVENEICEACGADVRPGSLFCYNCGESVTGEASPTASTNNKNKKVSSALLEDEIVKSNDLKTSPLDDGKIEKAADAPIPKPSIQEEAKLKSAANLRRKAKTFQRKTVEVVWEEPENAPNKWFPIVALLLTLFVFLIFLLAMYLK